MVKKDEDMHGLKCTSGLTWSARLSISRESWADVGRAYGTKSGIKQELIRLLGTREKQKALRWRDKALAALRAEVDEHLTAKVFLPLHGDWKPDWMSEEQPLSEALEARRQTTSTSDRTDGGDRQMGGTDPKRRLIEGMDCFLEGRAEQLEKAGKDSSGYVRRFREVDQSLFHRSCLRTGTQ